MSTPVEPTDVAHPCTAHYRPLHAHVRRTPPHRSDADDVVQKTWLRVIKTAARGLLGNGRAYPYRVAHNPIVDHDRQRARRREEALDDARVLIFANPALLPGQRKLDPEQLRHLDAIIAALPARSRQVFLLARVEQMGLAEIGRQLGITRQTAHGHLLRALVAVQQVPQV